MVLLRGSWGTGFRAPALYDLYTPVTRSVIFGDGWGDPLRCPITRLPEDCSGVYNAAGGGNPDLRPETSTQYNAGVVLSPASDLLLSANYWKLNKDHVIGTLDPGVIFAEFGRYAGTNIERGPVEPALGAAAQMMGTSSSAQACSLVRPSRSCMRGGAGMA